MTPLVDVAPKTDVRLMTTKSSEPAASMIEVGLSSDKTELKTGDKVTTSGGLRGTVVALKDDYIHLRVPPDNLRIEVSRASVAAVTTPDEGEKK